MDVWAEIPAVTNSRRLQTEKKMIRQLRAIFESISLLFAVIKKEIITLE